MPITDDQQRLLNALIRDHPDWTPDQIKIEFFRQIVEASPAYLDDSHVLPNRAREE